MDSLANAHSKQRKMAVDKCLSNSLIHPKKSANLTSVTHRQISSSSIHYKQSKQSSDSKGDKKKIKNATNSLQQPS